MSLSSGTRLGPYEILSAIGSGGMGDVYKARDTRLDRAVAIKVIQPAVAADAEIRERFEREARAISALDHPHICILYDVCREPAIAGGIAASEPVSFLVMQYLEGETLADRLARAGRPASDPSRPSSGSDSVLTTMSRGPIPFDTALKFAAEVAYALDAAHRRGIVHRDLKPGNVMLTKAGTKLLDFGLAKLSANDTAAGLRGFDPATALGAGGATRTSPFDQALTGQGAILGTLHYMAPEQLEGREVDARADIHAFGAVLFEMLCGRRAFDSPSQAGIIAAIIGADPPSLSTLADARTTLPVVAHRALDRLLTKCLAKNPDDRWQSAADLAAELQWINEERLRAVSEPAPAASASPAIAAGSRRRERAWMAITAAAVVALGGVTYWWYPRPSPPPEPVSFTIGAPEGEALSVGPGLLSLSPDGHLAFTTGTGDGLQLWVRRLGSLEPERLERAAGAWHPVWSPIGRSIAFTGSGGSSPLRRIDLAGAAPITLAPEATGRVAWSSTGVILFQGPENKLYRVPEAGGPATVAMELDGTRQETSLAWPTFLPDGRRYLFVARSSDPSTTGLFLASLDAPGRTFLANLMSTVDYAAGHLFYQRDGTLMAHPFDADAGALAGEAFPVVENIRYNAANGRAAFSVSASGVLAYVPGTDTGGGTGRKVMLFDRSGKNVRQIGAAGSYLSASFSPDGRQAVVVQEVGQQPVKRSLWLMDLERGVSTRFTVGDVDERSPVWSPDQTSIVYESTRDTGRGIYRRNAGGGATRDELLLPSDEQVTPTGFSADGKLLLFTRGVGPTQRIWILPIGGDRKPVEAFPGSTVPQYYGMFSPDSKWIAYSSGGPVDVDVDLQPYPADERRVRVSTSTGRFPRWTSDGRHIVYRQRNDELVSVELTPDGTTFRPSTPVPLFTERRGGPTNWHYDMDPRAERFLLIAPPGEATADALPPPITLIVNFTQGLGRK